MELPCAYRGEDYSVRDNGAVMRRSKPGGRRRPLDETWTFGTPSKSDGYMAISGHKIHRIVATAFHGEQPSKSHVVDHIDTNRRNNRPENLRWVTRLENILLNPITARRVKQLYGSIEAFLADPRNPKNGSLSREFEWMRAVTQTEASYSLKRMLAWAEADRPSVGGRLDEWVFGRGALPAEQPRPELVSSKTPGAVQRNWQVPAEFPLCPSTADEMPLATYFARLEAGAIAVISPWGETRVSKAAMLEDGSAVFILGEHETGAVKPFSLARITFEDAQFVHESCGTFFTVEGAEKEFTLARGLPWEGGETFDDFC
ncbi:HNH endonuclease [Paracoccus sp. R12_1]|uniref:HNH endonuclease signature motif containing protein n=1 Tax=unclassified Paracoccus (in: a-proteobacteria) TaxID=2688777 RepID=UPI001ADCD9D8|nr:MULTISPECIES: HNH endonuclease signature motif containing protein [unclassified Paracoccus (in: a-proteobacteria)]MBO9457385.1 HNH endonuclease [Paracoccus sp. R12_2]MBO9488657.1 HNH endonuclease [Paracoccus sp. R12_1]